MLASATYAEGMTSKQLSSLFLIATAWLGGCGAGSSDGSGGGGGSSGPGGPGSGTGAEGAGFIGSGGSSAGSCSADLKHVVDQNGNVIATCGPDEGCAGGQCVPACEAAAASKGSVGCDFMIPTPHFVSVILPPCFAAFVTNNWDKDIHISVSRAGQNYDVTQFGRIAQADPNVGTWQPVPATGLPPGQVAVLFLSDDPASQNGVPLTCPIQPAIRQGSGTQVQGSGVGAAWSIKTDAPVTTYDILPYGGADSFLPSAELVLPTTAWGTNYVAAVPTPGSLNGLGSMWGQIVATETTTITVLPNTNLPGAGAVPPINQGQSGSFTLNAGEYVQWNGPEMSGSIIQSDKPVAFIGGNTYQCYSSATSSGGGCDSGHQQISPVSATGSEYIGMAFKSRSSSLPQESIPYRLVGLKDGITLTFDPPIPGAPTTLGLGQSAFFEAQTPFRVTSQGADFPFYVGQSMSGCSLFNGDPFGDCLGDEDFVNMLPPAQWLLRYVFFTDPTYPTTNLVFTRKKVNGAFADVNLDCIGAVSGWQPIGSGGEYEITNVDLIRGGVANGACANGPHVAESAAPFGLTVWGLDTYSSYGYPAGGNATTINTVVVPPVPQ